MEFTNVIQFIIHKAFVYTALNKDQQELSISFLEFR